MCSLTESNRDASLVVHHNAVELPDGAAGKAVLAHLGMLWLAGGSEEWKCNRNTASYLFQ